MNPTSPLPRTTLRISAWVMLAIIILGYISLIPALNNRIALARESPAGRVVIGTFLVLCALDAVLLWAAALWYTWVKGHSGAVPRGVRVALLLIGNVAFAFIYYFGVVARERKSAASTD